MVDTPVFLKVMLGVPIGEFGKHFPQSKCTETGSQGSCRFDRLPKQICTMVTCLGGQVLFENGRSCGLIADAFSPEWIYVRNMMMEVAPTREEVQQTTSQTIYVSHWGGKTSDLYFTQVVSKQGPPASYTIGVMGRSPYSCYKQ